MWPSNELTYRHKDTTFDLKKSCGSDKTEVRHFEAEVLKYQILQLN